VRYESRSTNTGASEQVASVAAITERAQEPRPGGRTRSSSPVRHHSQQLGAEPAHPDRGKTRLAPTQDSEIDEMDEMASGCVMLPYLPSNDLSRLTIHAGDCMLCWGRR